MNHIPVISFFNNKGGVGKTTMVYHLAWMLAERGVRVLAADLDPQSNLTSAFLDENRLEQVFGSDSGPLTIYKCLLPLSARTGDVVPPHLESVGERLALVLGDMGLSTFEDELSDAWARSLSSSPAGYLRVTSGFWRILQMGAEQHGANVILMDLGPNLGAINRAALIGSDFVVIPLGADLFSLQGLKNLGPALGRWRSEWNERILRNTDPTLILPAGKIQPVGYIIIRHAIRLDRPVQAFERWISRIPETYRKYVSMPGDGDFPHSVSGDPNCIARLKDYRSLMPLAQEARKPMFFLKPADGALGAHTHAVKDAYDDFLQVAKEVVKRTGINAPSAKL